MSWKLPSVPLKVGMAEDVPGGFLPGLVEPVHVELPDEAVDVPVAEIFRQDDFFKLVNVLDGEFFSIAQPLDDPAVLVALPS